LVRLHVHSLYSIFQQQAKAAAATPAPPAAIKPSYLSVAAGKPATATPTATTTAAAATAASSPASTNASSTTYPPALVDYVNRVFGMTTPQNDAATRVSGFMCLFLLFSHDHRNAISLIQIFVYFLCISIFIFDEYSFFQNSEIFARVDSRAHLHGHSANYKLGHLCFAANSHGSTSVCLIIIFFFHHANWSQWSESDQHQTKVCFFFLDIVV
jgi:hypothetical protein